MSELPVIFRMSEGEVTARAERERQRQADEEARQERIATWRLALESLEARGDLSNVERAGIEAAKALGWN